MLLVLTLSRCLDDSWSSAHSLFKLANRFCPNQSCAVFENEGWQSLMTREIAHITIPFTHHTHIHTYILSTKMRENLANCSVWITGKKIQQSIIFSIQLQNAADVNPTKAQLNLFKVYKPAMETAPKIPPNPDHFIYSNQFHSHVQSFLWVVFFCILNGGFWTEWNL